MHRHRIVITAALLSCLAAGSACSSSSSPPHLSRTSSSDAASSSSGSTAGPEAPRFPNSLAVVPASVTPEQLTSVLVTAADLPGTWTAEPSKALDQAVLRTAAVGVVGCYGLPSSAVPVEEAQVQQAVRSDLFRQGTAIISSLAKPVLVSVADDAVAHAYEVAQLSRPSVQACVAKLGAPTRSPSGTSYSQPVITLQPRTPDQPAAVDYTINLRVQATRGSESATVYTSVVALHSPHLVLEVQFVDIGSPMLYSTQLAVTRAVATRLAKIT